MVLPRAYELVLDEIRGREAVSQNRPHELDPVLLHAFVVEVLRHKLEELAGGAAAYRLPVPPPPPPLRLNEP